MHNQASYRILSARESSAMAVGLALKPSADIAVLRDHAPLYVPLADGRVQSAYTVEIASMMLRERRYRLTLSGASQATLVLASDGAESVQLDPTARANSVETYRVFARAPRAELPRKSVLVVFDLSLDPGDESARHESVFLAP